MNRILVADNDVEQTSIHRKLLETLGYEVRTALSPAETLRELALTPIDLVIVDLQFPRAADGLELIHNIHQKFRRVPLIVLSGWPDDLYGTREEALVSGVVIKGNIRELVETIAKLLAA